MARENTSWDMESEDPPPNPLLEAMFGGGDEPEERSQETRLREPVYTAPVSQPSSPVQTFETERVETGDFDPFNEDGPDDEPEDAGRVLPVREEQPAEPPAVTEGAGIKRIGPYLFEQGPDGELFQIEEGAPRRRMIEGPRGR